MIIAFDVDGTIIDSKTNIVRPYIVDCIHHLSKKHTILIWSDNGEDYCKEVINRIIDKKLDNNYLSSIYNNLKFGTKRSVGTVPDFVIDNDVKIVRAFPGALVATFDSTTESVAYSLMIAGQILTAVLNFLRGKTQKPSKSDNSKYNDAAAEYGDSF